MSHEIRTPMNGVLGMVELLLRTDVDDEQRRFAETIRRSGQALLTIINDILDFSKVEAGKLELESTDFEPREIVGEVVELLASSAHEKRLELICHVLDDVPESVLGDPGRLRQILVNLVGNAIKFTDSGEVLVRVTLAEQGEDHDVLYFEVKDTGIGIEPDLQENIFESFSQGDATTRRKFGGTGLGLAVSKLLVELMAGRIGVRSEYGQGSTFYFTASFAHGQTIAPEQAGDLEDLRGLRALIIDDNATNREILTHHLESWGVRGETVADPFKALEILRRTPRDMGGFDLAIIDMMMPGMDGIELARMIHRDSRLENLRMLLLSSSTQYLTTREARRAGIQSFAAKPVRPKQLYQALLRAVNAPEERDPDFQAFEGPTGMVEFEATILVAEDNPVNREVAKGMLESMGCDVHLATNGIEAVQVATATRNDLILMDIQMPEIDGLEAMARIRAWWEENKSEPIPIIAVTANAIAGDREMYLTRGMDDYLSKPYNQEQLQELLFRWLGKKRPRVIEERSSETRAEERRSAIDQTVLGRIRVLETDNNRGVVARLIGIFAEDAPSLARRIRAGSDDEDMAAISKAAHTLKSSSANLGAMRLSEICLEIEDVIRRGARDYLPALVDALEHELDTVLDELRAEIETSSGSTFS